ncbi:hypothetical protein [Halomicrobium katesii]|uniref:hypothetical protein n=1 Tax=Halomicrobium katesii TaxID=437163 RepID=UPI00035FF748|nr:hypothetical protein [Halomicrobium katesii]
MPFETYQKGSSSSRASSQRPQLSLRKSGTIGLNASARQKHLEGFNYALMKYDAPNELIGIELYDEEVDGAYKIRKSKKENHGAQINCRGFTGEFGLRPDKTTRYPIEKADKGNMLVADLSEELKTIDG